MKTRLLFVVLALAFVLFQIESRGDAYQCTSTGVKVQDNFGLFDGWYCASSGNAGGKCILLREGMCRDGCAACGKNYVSVEGCTHFNEPPGSATAKWAGCISNYANKYVDVCNCTSEPTCHGENVSCSGQECCPGLYCNWNAGSTCQTYSSPILLALSNSTAHFHLTSSEGGVLFDIDGDGVLNQVAWTSSRSQVAFLAMDRNGNGSIDNGAELFGSGTRLRSGAFAKHGFEALQELDGNADGSITAADDSYHSLLLWTDENHDGLSSSEEMVSLAAGGVKAIATSYRESRRVDQHGNRYAYASEAIVVRAGRERRHKVFDVFFRVRF